MWVALINDTRFPFSHYYKVNLLTYTPLYKLNTIYNINNIIKITKYYICYVCFIYLISLITKSATPKKVFVLDEK
jgi:uncharacterized membrane protein YfbV (UPF0208 family)